MKGDKLHAKKVVSWGDTRWDLEVHKTFISDHSVDGPSAVRVKTIFEDFKPFQACHGRGESRVDLGKICHYRSLVRRVDWVRRVARIKATVNV